VPADDNDLEVSPMGRLALAGLMLLLGTSASLAQVGPAYDPPWSGIAVYRGPAANPQAPIAVYRGSAAPPAYLAPPAPAALPAQAVGGRRLWLIDPEDDRVTACGVGGTGIVGERVIRCVKRRLPAG
jgi:hypothetical protein